MNQILKRLLIVLASVFLLVYVGYHIYSGFAVTQVTQAVERVTAYQTIDTMGLVFRDETIISSDADGYFFYTVEHGNRVAKNGTIANVFPSLNDALGQQQLDQLDAEIETLSSINEQGTSNRANLSSINQQINQIWLSLSRAAQSSIVTNTDELHSQLLSLLNKKQLTIGKETNFNDRLAQLRSERDDLKSSFNAATEKVSSPVAGYFISQIDGFETVLTTDTVRDITVDEINTYLSAPAAKSSGEIGKVVGDYEWYLACVVSLEDTAFIKNDMTLDIRLPFVTNETIPAKVVSVNKDSSGRAAIVLKCTHMSGVLSTIRRERVELRVATHSGLHIPDDAVYFNENQEPGVYVQTGNYLSFRKIQVLFHDPKGNYSVCAVTNDKAYVKLYDKLVIEGEDLYDGKLVR